MRCQPIENFSELILTLDGSGLIQQVIEPASLLGSHAGFLLQKAFLNLLDPSQAESFEACLLKTAFQPGYASFTTFEIIRPDGVRTQLEAMLRHVAPNLVQLDARDITALRGSSVLRDRALDATTSAFCISDATNPEMPLIYVNPAFERISGYRSDEILGKNCRFLQGNDRNQPAVAELRSAIRGGRPCRVVLRNYKKTGELFWNDLTMSPIFDQAGRLTHFVGVQSEITQEKLLESKVMHSAFHDGLTDLPNRLLFLDRLGKSLQTPLPLPHHTYAVLLFDINGFKAVNEMLGHQGADQALIHAAKCIKGAVREGDTAARLAGDQFAVLASEVTGQAQALQIGRRILDALGERCLVDGKEIQLSASAGIALASDSSSRFEDILRNAESALSRAKRTGRDSCVLYDRGWRAEEETRMQLESGIRRALSQGEFTVYYQPIVDLRTGSTVMFEALVRWVHPQRGLLSPGLFLPAAEDSGLIVPVGEFTLAEVCRQLALWRTRTCPADLSVCVNLSGQEFAQPAVVERIGEVLKRYQIPPSYLRIELTETIVMDSPETARAKLKALRNLGIHVKIDDFGTGHSSLARLQNLAFDALKIDKSFIDHIEHDKTSYEIVRSITAMAHTLGLQVVAEGVETAGQARTLVEFGCEYGQGYHFAKPMPAEQAFKIFDVPPELAVA